MPQWILPILKSKTMQGVIVALGAWFASKFGTDPGSTAQAVADVATAVGGAWGAYGLRDAIGTGRTLAVQLPITHGRGRGVKSNIGAF